ncbi:hypothetical protein DFH09DRAFT_1173879 [Mycena vulgaris]|nr:hypothetical protein DFH09DRAFT_1173879 [Mycena vulgaris]
MYRLNVLSVPSAEPHIDGDGSGTPTRADDSAHNPTNSARSLLPRSREAPKTSPLTSSKTLRLASLILHSSLVAIHVTLIGISATALEHRVIFSLEYQTRASLAITAISTTVGTIYSALLVFITQTLFMRKSLQTEQTVTATHDTASSWAGIGSAIFQIWHQKAVPASITGVLSAFLYLACILVLHITTPALFSLETFNPSSSVPVGTQSLPAFDQSSSKISSAEDVLQAFTNNLSISAYMSGSLYYLPSVIGKTTNPGLYKGTLYDVLDIDSGGTGNATVNATGFSITCGYLPNVKLNFLGGGRGAWVGTLDDGNSFEIQSTLPGVISTGFIPNVTLRNSVIFYSTIPILDSNGSPGPMITLDPPMDFSVSAIQIFECSQTLISQTAVVDAQSRELLSVEPGIEKSTSTWGPYAGPPQLTTFSDTNPLLYAWGNVYSSMPNSQFPRYLFDELDDIQFVSVADLYLIQNLNLRPVNDAPANVALHELENALSVVASSMFWTVGHIPATQGPLNFDENSDKSRKPWTIGEVSNPLHLLPGSATVEKISTRAQLDLSAGLVASTALLILSLPSSLFNGSAKKDSDLSIDGTGILHAIWLYRNHPELETLLEHVEHPTHDNLRQAGMVRTRLTTGQVRKRRRSESF